MRGRSEVEQSRYEENNRGTARTRAAEDLAFRVDPRQFGFKAASLRYFSIRFFILECGRDGTYFIVRVKRPHASGPSIIQERGESVVLVVLSLPTQLVLPLDQAGPKR